MRKLIKISTLIISILLIFSLLSACKTAEDTEETTKATTMEETTMEETTMAMPKGSFVGWPTMWREDSPDQEWMEDISPITFTIFYNSVVTDDWKWGSTKTSAFITEQTGVTLDVQFASDKSDNELILMMASGDKMPDFLHGVHATFPILNEIIEGGFAAKVNELIDEYAPQTWDIMDPFIAEFSKMEDGNIYYIVRQAQTLGLFDNDFVTINGSMAARLDILDDLGYKQEEVTTSAIFEEILEKFMQNADKYPEVEYPIFIGSTSIASGTFGALFGLPSILSGTPVAYNKDTDKLHFWFDSEEGRSTLKYFNQLYQKGYIKAEAFIEEDARSLFQTGKVFFHFSGNVVQSVNAKGDLREALGSETAEYAAIGPFTVTGDPWITTYFPAFPTRRWVTIITTDNHTPERAIEFMQYLMSDEGNAVVWWGLYGEDWIEKTDPETGVKYPEKIGVAKDFSGDFSSLHKLGLYDWRTMFLANDSTYDLLGVYDKRFNPETANAFKGTVPWTKSTSTRQTNY